jgi:putative multiple sugar transport system permease protein
MALSSLPHQSNPTQSKSFIREMGGGLKNHGLFISLIAIMVFFQIMTDGALFEPLNLTNIILQNSYIVVMALGMLLVIVAGHVDLSVGSVCGFIGAVAAVLMVNLEVNYFLAALICLLLGALIGAVQGYWIAYHQIPSFIVTLAGMLVFKGLALAVLQGRSVGPFPEEFQLLSTGFIADPFQTESVKWLSFFLGVGLAVVLFVAKFRDYLLRIKHGVATEHVMSFIGTGLISAALILGFTYQLASYKGLPNVILVMGLLIFLYDFITRRTVLGRRIYALGGNAKAARLSGIKTERLTLFAFVNLGVLSALAGLIFAARLNTATPKAGLGFELDVIAACFIGGASASGGVGKVMGAVVGAFIMGVMNNGMSIMGIGIDYQQVIKGVVLLAAVCIDVYNQKK